MSDRKDQLRGTSVVFPLLLIGFGALMLLWRWMPDFYPWGVLLKYWPLLFICIGAGMIWDRTRWQSTSPDGRRFPIGSALGTLVFLLVITILIHRDHSYFPRYSGKTSAASTHETKTVDHGAATSLRMNVEMPAGELIFQGGGEHLLSADFFQDGSWQVPHVDYSVVDQVGNLKISQSGNDRSSLNRITPGSSRLITPCRSNSRSMSVPVAANSTLPMLILLGSSLISALARPKLTLLVNGPRIC